MNNFLPLLLLLVSVFHAHELKEEYLYTDPTIVSTDLFPEVEKRFEVVRIPAEKTLYRLDAQTLAKTFELHGITIDTAKIRYVNFVKKSPVDLTSLEDQLAEKLRERYPSIRIRAVKITPRGYLDSLPHDAKGFFDNRIYQNGSGTFYVLNSQGLRRYLDYSVDALLPVLHTTRRVLRKETLGGSNTLLKPVPFTSFKDIPLTAFPSESVRFRSNLKNGTLLNVRNIEAVPLVLRNENVIVQIRNGSVVLELSATATQEGALYDIITIQKRDGKRSKAKVIGKNRVELQ
ncbi:MAG: flagellar basal body P-ring formation protein FlgA [Campylobacterales bacterium]|nr:flagellar basal body P-ring formation protein FlgA [Campylobacterales bacterium]